MSRSFFTVVIFFLGIVTLSEAQSKKDKEKSLPLFTIAKKPVATEEFIYLYRKNHQNKPEEFTKEKVGEYLDLFINFKLKVEEAKRRGLDTTAAFRKEYNTYREELRKPYLPDTRLVDSLVQITYNRLKEEIKATHILINVSPSATPTDTAVAYQRIMALRTRVMNGEDFETLAKTQSEDPTAKMNSGNLGYFTAMQMVFPFEQVAYSTPVGKISMPVRTQFGYHIIKVVDRRPSRGEVEVSHIMIRPGADLSSQQAKNTIFEIYDQLQKGVKWEDLVAEYSQDPASKDKGGRLRAFGVGAIGSAPEFEQVAFSLKEPGSFSDPFQTAFGWHIIRLEKKIPLPPFHEIATSLKTRVSRDERVKISREALQQKMKKDFGFTENEEAKAKVFSLADSSLTAGKWSKQVSDDLNSAPLFAMSGKNYPVKDFISYVKQNQRQINQPPSQFMQQLYSNYTDVIHGHLLEERIKQQNPDYTWLLKEYYEGILLFDIMEKEVWNKAAEDSVGQAQYFSTNAANYVATERIQGRIYSSANKENIDQIKTLLEKNDTVKAQQFASTNKVRQESGSFQKNDRPVLAKISFAPGIQAAENNGMNYLVCVNKVLSPGRMSFDEARPSLLSDYQTFLEKKWLAQLKKKYPVKINKKGQQFVMDQLTKR
jgi:peptidyl-prolyl cis-trans isomerase SurA